MQTEDDRIFSGIVAIALLHFNLYSDIVDIVSLQVVEYCCGNHYAEHDIVSIVALSL